MFLVLNAIVDLRARERFDAHTLPRVLGGAAAGATVAHLVDPAPLPAAGDVTRLLVSGSELSASTPHARDAEVERLLRGVVEAGAPVLGICWGHQLLARALGGTCRPAAEPEVGWRRVEVTSDPLFEGLHDPVFAHSHYDEVGGVPAAFDVIAWTPGCAVQAVRVRGAPAWGVQFHPEVGYVDGRAMFQQNVAARPDLAGRLFDDLEDPGHLDQNLHLFERFLGA